jgi:hypothetical protein
VTTAKDSAYAHPPPTRDVQAVRERSTRGLMLYIRERARIHRLYADTWAVPSPEGGYWRVNLIDETCGCRDFRYLCTDRVTGAPFMNCKHIVAAAIARAKGEASPCPSCMGRGFVCLGVEEDGVERAVVVRCKRCRQT